MSQTRTQKLVQVIAIERPAAKKAGEGITALYQVGQKAGLFIGQDKVYEKVNDAGDELPSEGKIVELTTRGVLKGVARDLTDIFDITAAKDYANCNAKADVVVDGKTLIEGAPATYLIFLEKYLVNVRTIVSKLPTLSTDEDWKEDDGTLLHKSKTKTTYRTHKVQDKLVLLEPTDKHPGQAQVITKDVAVGTWETTLLSGAMPVPTKEKILDRIEVLMRAVKFAREHANTVEAPEKSVGKPVFDYLFEGAT